MVAQNAAADDVVVAYDADAAGHNKAQNAGNYGDAGNDDDDNTDDVVDDIADGYAHCDVYVVGHFAEKYLPS